MNNTAEREIAVAREPVAVTKTVRSGNGSDESYLPIVTLVAWMLVLAVGLLGICLPYPQSKPPVKETPAVQAEVVNVELTAEPISASILSPPLLTPSTPPSMSENPAIDLPPMISVAELSAADFALPVEGPTRVVATQQANYVTTTASNRSVVSGGESGGSSPVAQKLIFGEGEGKQPAPEYPRQSLREGQQGVVTIRFDVAESGRVSAADIAISSPWRLLNEAALRVVRERWRFKSGSARRYEVAVRFSLQN